MQLQIYLDIHPPRESHSKKSMNSFFSCHASLGVSGNNMLAPTDSPHNEQEPLTPPTGPKSPKTHPQPSKKQAYREPQTLKTYTEPFDPESQAPLIPKCLLCFRGCGGGVCGRLRSSPSDLGAAEAFLFKIAAFTAIPAICVLKRQYLLSLSLLPICYSLCCWTATFLYRV